MRKSNKIALLLGLALVTAFSGCAKKHPASNSTSSSSQLTSNDNTNNNINYYDKDNFVPSSKVVKKTKLVTYDGPSLVDEMENVDIKVNDQDLFVYKTRVNHNRKFSWSVPETYAPVSIFDFEGKVHVDINVKDVDITKCKISPQVYGIEPTINNNTISFDLSYPDNYVISYNDDDDNAIHLFASSIEEDPITQEEASKDPSITYIGPGVYKADAIPVKSNSTLYIAGGAYVFGQIRTEGIENLTIRGRGIISGSIYYRRSESEYTIPLEVRKSNNITIKDVSFFDPAGWTIALYKSKDIRLENVKIISARQNSDGISVQSCENVEVQGGFIRTWDDSLVVKNVDRGSTKNVHFKGVKVWTDLAQSMEVGYETYGPTMEDISFEDITIIHNYHKAAISLHNCDDASISGVTYKNITIEDGAMLGDNQTDGINDFLIDFTIAYNADWTKSEGKRGACSAINIENVKVYSLKDTIISRIFGESNESKIDNVNIKDIEINGKKISTLDELNIATNSFVSNVSYNQTNSKITGAHIYLPYTLDLENENCEKTNVQNITQTGLLVPEFSYSKSEAPYIGVKSNVTGQVTSSHSKGTKATSPSDDGSGDFSKEGTKASNAYDNNSQTSWISKEWKNEQEEFACLTVEFDKLTKVGVIRIYADKENQNYSTYSIQVWGLKLKKDGTINDKYTRLTATKDYELTPSKNNIIDVSITCQEYKGLQLRLYKGDSLTSAMQYEISEIEFYPPSLSYGAAIVDATANNDVYNVEKIVDGEPNGTSYYESKGLPAYIVIDLGDLYDINTIVLSLPGSLLWDARTQKIQILASSSNLQYDKNKTQFNEIVETKEYLFDPLQGNRNIISFPSTNVRFLKIIISSNSNVGGYGAQLSEVSVY